MSGSRPSSEVPDGLAMSEAGIIEFMTEGFGRPFEWPIELVDASGLRLVKPPQEGELRPGGTISGPAVMALADAAAYMVLVSRIGPQSLAVTTNLNCDFLRRPKPGEMVADATILKLGRTLAVIDVLMYSREDGELTEPVARAGVTYSMALLQPRPEDPK